jgi:ribosomal protein S18 acetylase RimI-like enzyme
MTDDELIARTDSNYFAVWPLFCSLGEGGGEVIQRGGLIITDSGAPLAMFNNVFVTRPLADPLEALRDAVALLDARGRPFLVRIREGLDPAADRACGELGLVDGGVTPGMALSDVTKHGSPVAGLTIVTAATRETFLHHVEMIVGGFGVPRRFVEALLTDHFLHVPDAELYVGYLDNKPVASSALFVTGRTAGVYNVATLPDVRGRGIGEAMTWHCVRRGAAMGCVAATLQASDMGYPIYERMGFRLVSPYRTYHRP